MLIYPRLLQLPDFHNANVFLWGPRKTGKSSWIRENLRDAISIDLLKSDVYAEFASRPSLLRERYEHVSSDSPRHPIVIDEIQKCPQLLDEVHWLIENTPQRFLLTGSSARKLRRHHANMLGGRAWRRELRPLTSHEINLGEPNSFDIERAITHGLLPAHYIAQEFREELRGYVADYLRDEIADEAAVRNLPAFAEFLRVASITSAELLNYANVAREVGVSPKVVRSYFEILDDTLLGFRVLPWSKSVNRRLVETEKFYLFDVGVCNYLARRVPALGTPEFGKSFEHFILMELMAYRAYFSPELDIRFWRTSNKQEVDFILNDKEVAIEIKSSSRTDVTDCKSLGILAEDGAVRRRILVSFDRERKVLTDRHGPIEVLPWRAFLEELWSKQLIS
jgi:predicted AAA+ superfamily ATPase